MGKNAGLFKSTSPQSYLRAWTKYGSAFSGSKYQDNHGVQLIEFCITD